MAETELKLAVFISGRGSNLQALIDACRDPAYPASISVVISDKTDAYGLERARMAGIPSEVVKRKDFSDKAGFEKGMQDKLSAYDVDLICLAGFMRILSADFIRLWSDRIVNIHPSLLPAYKGLNVHERVLADEKTESGCSVHYVTPSVDDGPVIVQRKVPVQQNDTPETLASRILVEEHKAYPEAVEILAKKLLGSIDEPVQLNCN